MLAYDDPLMTLNRMDFMFGQLNPSAFMENAIGISCACNSATNDEHGSSLKDYWEAYFGFVLYSVNSQTSYRTPESVVPVNGGSWQPSNPFVNQ